ncbi:helix-turn-helix transcriptional regulator, partial [Salipiger sp. PrR003]
QAELASRAEVHRVTVAEIETGRKNGSLDALKRLAAALCITVDDLI